MLRLILYFLNLFFLILLKTKSIQKSWPRSFLSAGIVFDKLQLSTQRNFVLLCHPKNDWIPESSSGLSHFFNGFAKHSKTENPEGPNNQKIPVQFKLFR